MNPVQLFGEQIRDLVPRRVRRTMYSVWTLLGALLAAWQTLNWGDLGPISATEAVQAYAFLSPALVALAAVNAPKPREDEVVDWVDDDADDDVDVSSFDPVVDPDAVFA
jgi:hypothetical protein